MIASIIMQCKNDNYLNNFKQRFNFTLSKHIQNIRELKLDKEYQIVLTDWGSEIPFIEINDTIKKNIDLIKYIYVEPEIAKKYNKDIDYSYVHPFNVSARNSDGEYIILGDSDGFMPFDSFVKLNDFILKMKENNDMCFYWGSRTHLERKDYYEFDNTNQIEELIKNSNNLRFEKVPSKNFPLPFGGGAVIFLCNKNIYHESTGMWEKLIYWGVQDLEFHRRLLRKYEYGGDLYEYEIKCYHLEHFDSNRYSPKKTNDPLSPDCQIFNANGENWGLGDEKKLKIIYEKT